jgi:hypothetical protein
MDSDRFDGLTRSLSTLLSRRTLAGGLGLGVATLPVLAEAKKKHKHTHKKKKKAKFNDFGCVNVGDFCKNDDQCCSGICEGKKCQAHDTSSCLAGDFELVCGGVDVLCVASDGGDGFCDTTTGKAGYCRVEGHCFDCTKDADCVPFCGPHAACIVCEPLCRHGGDTTSCVGPAAGSCTFPP